MRRTTVVIAAALVTITGTTAFRLLRNTGPTPPKPAVAPEPFRAPNATRLQVLPSTTTPPNTPMDTPTRAAVRFLNLDEQLFPDASPEKARALSESIAATATRQQLGAAAAESQRRRLTNGDLGGLMLRIAPIGARTRNCTDDACTVDVFFLRLWSFPGKGALDDYATVEIHLIREQGEWRLVRSSVIDGPYPVGRYSARATSAIEATSFEMVLAGFTDTEVTP